MQLSIGQNFVGATLGVDSTLVPPDANGAAGPAHFVELVNGRYSVYSKTNGHRVETMTDVAFWAQAGVNLPSGWETTDPRLIYDPSVQRWFASQLDVDPNGSTHNFLLGVSASADPTGQWKAVRISSDFGGTYDPDFDTLGLDSQGVYLSADLFDNNGNSVGPTLISIPKAGLLASSPVTNGLTSFGVMSYNVRGMILQPAVCTDGSGNGSILAAGGLGIDNSGNFVTDDTLIGFSILNAGGPGKATLTSSTIIQVPGYTAPYDPTQPPPNPDLDDGDSRFSALVYQVGGVLYAIHSTEVNNLAALRWYRINATNHAVLETGTITDPTLDLFYPSIAANANGIVVIACNGCSATTYVSSYAYIGQTVGGVTSFGNGVLLKSGVGAYSDGSSPSRWGDYSTTSVDPADPTRFWTIQTIPANSSTWSTQITELITTITVPTLTIVPAGNDVVISWPASATGFNLESTASLSTPSWAPVSQQPSIINGQFVVQVQTTGAAAFFRLNLP